MKTKEIKVKRLDDSDPGIFDQVAKYLLMKKKEKDDKNYEMIKNHFSKIKWKQ